VVYAVDLALVKDGMYLLVEPARALQVMAKGLLDDDTCPACVTAAQPGPPELLDNAGIQHGGGRQVEQAVALGAGLGVKSGQSFTQAAIGVRIVVAACQVGMAWRELRPHLTHAGFEPCIICHALQETVAELLVGERAARHA